MKIDVPFFKQTTSINCGPASLKMVFDYFGLIKDIDEISSKSGTGRGNDYTISIARAAALFGFNTDFYSNSTFYEEEKNDIFSKHAKNAGVKMHNMSFSLENVIGFLSKDSIPIFCVEWNTLYEKPKKKVKGHFMPLVGYDKQNVYLHNSGIHHPREFMKFPKHAFENARKFEGVGEEFIVISRENKYFTQN